MKHDLYRRNISKKNVGIHSRKYRRARDNLLEDDLCQVYCDHSCDSVGGCGGVRGVKRDDSNRGSVIGCVVDEDYCDCRGVLLVWWYMQ